MQYGIRREAYNFQMDNSTVTFDNMSNITINAKHCKGREDLWKFLIRKNVNCDTLDKNELQKYKTILDMTNTYLEGYKPWGNIQTSHGTKIKNVIVLDVWECDLVDVQALNKFNNNYHYLLKAIDVFSKLLHIDPLKSKTDRAVT